MLYVQEEPSRSRVPPGRRWLLSAPLDEIDISVWSVRLEGSLDIPPLAVGFFHGAADVETALAGTDVSGSGGDHGPSRRITADCFDGSEWSDNHGNVIVLKNAVHSAIWGEHQLFDTSSRRDSATCVGDRVDVGENHQSVLEVGNERESWAVESLHDPCR